MNICLIRGKIYVIIYFITITGSDDSNDEYSFTLHFIYICILIIFKICLQLSNRLYNVSLELTVSQKLPSHQ